VFSRVGTLSSNARRTRTGESSSLRSIIFRARGGRDVSNCVLSQGHWDSKVLCLSMAFMIVSSFRIQATSAIFPGFP